MIGLPELVIGFCLFMLIGPFFAAAFIQMTDYWLKFR